MLERAAESMLSGCQQLGCFVVVGIFAPLLNQRIERSNDNGRT